MESARRADNDSEKLSRHRNFRTTSLNVIGKLSEIQPVKIKIALKYNREATFIKFLKICTLSSIVLRLTAGPLALVNVSFALVNVTFLILNCELAPKEVLLWIPLLQHLGTDTNIILENIATTLMVTGPTFNQARQIEKIESCTCHDCDTELHICYLLKVGHRLN